MKKERNVFKFFIDFYRRICIPWWMYILSSLSGILYAEITLKAASFLIRVNKGELFNSVIIGYVLLTVLNSFISFAGNVLAGYANQKVILRSRNILWRKILHMPVKDVEDEQPSTIISAVTNELSEAAAVINTLFLSVASVYGFVRACSTLYKFQATLTLYMLLLVPLTIFIFFIVGKLQYQIMKKRYGSINVMTTFFSEHLSAGKYVKVNSMEEKELESGNRAIDTRYKADIYNTFMSTLGVFLNSLSTNISTVAIAFGGSKLIRSGAMESTGINDFSTYMQKVEQYTAENLTHYQNLMGTKGALSHVNKLLNMPRENPEKGEEWQDSGNKDIVFENVDFGYNKDRVIIHGLSMTIPSNRVTAVIGDNGCGKSTIMKLMQGFYKPSSGNIRVGENEVGKVKMADLRGKFSYVLQDNPLFAGTIRDNIAYGVDHKVTDEEVAAAAKAACIDEFIIQLPMGYDTQIGESGSSLSGGQRQRIAIARALMLNPEYLILDEAGASIDHETYEKIYNAITHSEKRRTVILISHDMREVMQAENIIVMNKGQVEACGTHEQLLQTSRTYKDYMDKLMA
jgi:ATP-binding cassette subfamily B protein AbcA/BmrA